MSKSRATHIKDALVSDLLDWYDDQTITGIDSVEVNGSYSPIFDIGSRTPGVMYVTVYESTTDLTRLDRADNDETSDVQVAVQMRFDGAPETSTIDQLRYELQEIADRYFGENAEAGDRWIRASECSFGAVNDPNLVQQQNAYFGVAIFSFRDRGEVSG